MQNETIKIHKELNKLCNIVFNQHCTKYSIILPDLFKKHRYNNHTFTLKEIYFQCKEKIEILNGTERICVAKETIKIPQFLDLSPKIKLIEKIYNNSQFFDYIIHGSYADNTYTSFSDVDDLIIIKKETFETFKNFKEVYTVLKNLNIAYQSIDPTQHHGHWIISEFELNNYDDSVIPVSIFRDKVFSVGRPISFRFSLIDSKSSTKEIFSNILLELLEEQEALFSNRINMYALKNLLSDITLLLPLYYQLKGEKLTKSQAIFLTKKNFNEKDLILLDWATQIRSDWTSIKGFGLYPYLRKINRFFGNRNLTARVAECIMPKIKTFELPQITVNDFNSFITLINAHEN